jgi:hypothetical protein
MQLFHAFKSIYFATAATVPAAVVGLVASSFAQGPKIGGCWRATRAANRMRPLPLPVYTRRVCWPQRLHAQLCCTYLGVVTQIRLCFQLGSWKTTTKAVFITAADSPSLRLLQTLTDEALSLIHLVVTQCTGARTTLSGGARGKRAREELEAGGEDGQSVGPTGSSSTRGSKARAARFSYVGADAA